MLCKHTAGRPLQDPAHPGAAPPSQRRARARQVPKEQYAL